MSLLSRLVSPEEGEAKIPIHAFMASVAEKDRNAPGVDSDFIMSQFDIPKDGKEDVDLLKLLLNMGDGKVDRAMIHDVLLLGEAGVYPESQVELRLQMKK